MNVQYNEIKGGRHFRTITLNPDMISEVFDFFNEHQERWVIGSDTESYVSLCQFFRTSENGFEIDLLSAKYVIRMKLSPFTHTVLSSSECSHFVVFNNII